MRKRGCPLQNPAYLRVFGDRWIHAEIDVVRYQPYNYSKLSIRSCVRDTSSPGYVADATPLRDSVVMWRPNVPRVQVQVEACSPEVGWIELPRAVNASDSAAT